MVTWIKANSLIFSAAVAWLLALAPIGKFGKGIAHVVALSTSIESVRYSRQLVLQEARRGAMAAMNQEMEVVDLSLQAYSQEQALREMYGINATYTPEVREELEKSLEHLVQEPSASRDGSTSASTSRKNLYLAVVSLLEVGKSESYIVEEVLGYKGRRFKEGQRALQDLLQEGRENEW
jgi:hypothetical protein